MNAVATRPDRSPAAGCTAYQGDDPCLPCALANADDAEGHAPLRRRLHRGEALFREGDPCRSIYAVRSGTFKTVIPGLEGREQVSGFQLAGDVLGLDGLAHGRHASRAVALEDSEVVVLPYGGDARGDPRKLVEVLPRLIGRELVRKQKLAVLLSCMSAEQRLASFLLNLSRRLEAAATRHRIPPAHDAQRDRQLPRAEPGNGQPHAVVPASPRAGRSVRASRAAAQSPGACALLRRTSSTRRAAPSRVLLHA